MLNKADENEGKEAGIRRLFSTIAPRYDLLNSVMSLGMHKRWRRLCVRWAGVERGDAALDVCCGSGDFAFALAETVGREGCVVGTDFSASMLRIAENKAVKRGLEWVEFQEANVCELPFDSDSFDIVTVGFGLRNVPDLAKALSEMGRVTKPGGNVVNLEIMGVRGSIVTPLWKLYFSRFVPWFTSLLGGDKSAYRYLPSSVEEFVTPEQMMSLMTEAGYEDVKCRPFVFGAVCAFVGKKSS